MRVHHLIF